MNTVKKRCTSLARTLFENRLNSAPFYPRVYCQLALINALFLIDGCELLKVCLSIEFMTLYLLTVINTDNVTIEKETVSRR